MKKKIFFCSDIHGYYDVMINTLKFKGFDENNPNHLLVVLGDIFDRGDQAVQVYEYLKRLTDKKKAVVVSGNHHKFLIEFLEGSYNPFNYMNNGLSETIGDFWHRTMPFESWCLLDKDCTPNSNDYAEWVDICRKDIMEEYPELLDWLKSMPRYFESKNIIGCHASLDLNAEDWRKPHCIRYTLRDWDALEFDDGMFLARKNTTGKTIVAGHFDTGHLREMHNLGVYDDHSILKTEDNKIFIDGCVALTQKLNVLILEDEYEMGN